MPKHRPVPSLKKICLKRIGNVVGLLAPVMAEKMRFRSDPCFLKRNIDRLRKILVFVGFHLYDQMAIEVLTVLRGLIVGKYNICYADNLFLTEITDEMNVVLHLIEVVLTSELKELHFQIWPRAMKDIMYKNLYKLTGLRVLNLGSGTHGMVKSISDGIRIMKNLRSFCLQDNCTDTIVQTIADNCPNIQRIDIESSTLVTDRSVSYFIKCRQVKELYLYETSISTDGLVQILLEMPNLQDIGTCDEFGTLLQLLHEKHSNTIEFGLTKIQTELLSTDHLRILVDMFPKIKYIDLGEIDFTVVAHLEHLKEVKLLGCTDYSAISYFMEIRGNNITGLYLERLFDLSVETLIDISQHCPRLNIFHLHNCRFVNDDVNLHVGCLKVHPFLNLERLHWVDCLAIRPLEFILCHAVSLKKIHLDSCEGVTHSLINNVLAANPLNELEELRIMYSANANMTTVKLILSCCVNLKVLSKLENWAGITKNELHSFKQYVDSNNFDLYVT